MSSILTVTVPAGATSGTISVTSPSGTATSTSSFTVTAASGAPSITSFTPQIVSAGSTTTLAGTNFDTTPANDHLVVNNTPAAVPTSVTSTSMVMTAPTAAGSGHVSLDTLGGGTTISAADLFIPPPGFSASQVAYTGRTTFGNATTVSVPVTHSIGLLLFDGQFGHTVSIALSSPSFSSCTFQIFNPDNTALGSSASCSSAGFLDAQALPANGTYTILINASGGSSGGATFTVYDSSDLTGTLTAGGPAVTVTTATPGQNVRLIFVGTQNQHASLTLSNSSFTSCSLSVLNPDGTTLVSPSSCTNSTTFIEVPYLNQIGAYVIKLDPGSTQTGAITVKLNDATDVTGPLIVGGSSVTATTTAPGQNASYTFPGTLNQHVSISILSSTFSNCVIEVFKPDGTTLVNGPPCNSTSTFYDVPLLPVAGTYRLIFDPQGTETGTITFKLNDATDITGTITTDGTPVTITTTVPGQNAKLTFSGTAGQMISGILDNNTYAIGVNWSLLAPDGSTVASPANGRGTLFMDDARYCQLAGGGQYLCGNITLPSAGTYTLFLDPATTDTGQVRARLFSVTDPTASGTLNGPAVPVTIATPGQNGKITFSGTQGGRVAVAFSGASFNGVVNPGFNFEILNPDGSLYAGPFSGGPFNFSTSNTSGFLDYNDTFLLPSTGTYTVVLDPTADTTGFATVNIYDATDASMNINADGNGNTVTTTAPGQNAHLNFSFTLGQRVSVLMTNIQYTHQPDLILRRVDTNGVLTNYQFSSPIGATRFIDGTTLADPGTYFLFFDPFSQETGSATVTMYTVTDISGTLDTAGTPFTATTTTPGQNANLTFSGSSGQNVTLTVSNTDFAVNTCSLSVMNPNGSQLFAVGCRNTGAPWSQPLQLPQNGTYTVVIDPTNANTGSLTVSITAQ